MADETFQSVVNDLSNFHLSALVAAPIGETGREARDYHHTFHSAIREIAAELESRVATAQEIERLAADEDSI